MTVDLRRNRLTEMTKTLLAFIDLADLCARTVGHDDRSHNRILYLSDRITASVNGKGTVSEVAAALAIAVCSYTDIMARDMGLILDEVASTVLHDLLQSIIVQIHDPEKQNRAQELLVEFNKQFEGEEPDAAAEAPAGPTH